MSGEGDEFGILGGKMTFGSMRQSGDPTGAS